MINQLTKEQEEKIPIYLKKWLDNGYSTEPLNRSATAESIKWVYEFSGKKTPYMWFCDSPLQANILIALLKEKSLLQGVNLRDNLWDNIRYNLRNNLRDNISDNLSDNLWDNISDNLSDNLWGNLRNNLSDNLRDNISDNLWDNLRDNVVANLSDNLWDNLWNNLSDNLWDNLRDNISDNLLDTLSANPRNNLSDNLWDNLRDNISDNLLDNASANLRINLSDNLRNNLWDNLRDNVVANLSSNLRDRLENFKIDFNYFFSPSLESYWVGNYDFILNELFPERKDEFSVFNTKCIDFYKNNFFIIPFDGICFISERPTEIKTVVGHNGRNVLHCDGGPCMSFKDGYEVHALNGIIVSKEIAETPGHLLDSNIVLREKNADIRREIVRKIGTEKLCTDLNAKCVDKSPDGMYELLMLNLNDGRMRPYLKMINPSIGVYHIEGVHPDCTTVESALMFRNGTSQKPIKLT